MLILELMLLGITILLYSDKSNGFINTQVTDTELGILSEELWSLDTNNVFNLIIVNVQGSASFDGKDNAARPLLVVKPEAYQGPTISKLVALQDNYIPAVGKKEVTTSQESLEENEFLDAILATPLMKKAEQFLKEKGYIFAARTSPRNPRNQTNSSPLRDALQEIWFGVYSREKSILGSSGFEHSFVGEIKNGEVSGFHNWVYFARQEANGKVNYKGHKRILNLGRSGMILKDVFTWENIPKQVGTMFVGTSPELEMALYTVCFYARPGVTCPLKLSRKSVGIKTHFLTRGGKKYVGSAYPEI